MKENFTMKMIILLLVLFAADMYAQAPAITSFSPAVVTQRTTVVITGSNFTGITTSNVKFGGISAAAITVNSPTQITAIVGNGASGNVTVTNSNGTASLAGLTYVAPATTPANAKITRAITNYNGYWNSASISADTELQPDKSHSLLGFEFMGTIYATGSATATSVLTANSVPFQNGNFRALPVHSLTGVVAALPNTMIVLGTKVDGKANEQDATAAGVAGLTVKDVLIDGLHGLDLGTGTINLPLSATMTFSAENISEEAISDNIPDLVISQLSSPLDNVASVYCFTDEDGNIVGIPVQAELSAVPAIGSYKADFFTLPADEPLNTATINGSFTTTANVREIKLAGLRLSDFGITTGNKNTIKYLKVMPGGGSPAFVAYNTEAFAIPAPLIATEPASQVACTGQGESAVFTVSATGDNLTYQWKKNGIDIAGANLATLTINNVEEGDVAAYSVMVTNSFGSDLSACAYLNTVISVSPQDTPACQNSNVKIEVTANGADVHYQWYSNTTNSNNGGTLIPGATSGIYLPNVTAAGTKYYYAVITNNGLECLDTKTQPVAVTVTAQPIAGTASGTTSICPGNTATVSVAGYTGSIQWQQSTTGIDGWASVTGGLGGTTASYTTPVLSGTRYYRAELSTGPSCPAVTTAVIAVTVNDFLTWTGAVSSDWHNEANWSCSTIPTLSHDVVIPATANQPVVSNTAQAALGKSLTINNGAKLTVNEENNIQILTAINVANNGQFILSCTANLTQDNEGTVNNNTGKATVHRESNPLYRLDYSLWSTPVEGQNIFQFSPQTVANRFYTYNTANDQFNMVTNLSPTSTTTFDAATAYLIRMPNGDPAPGYNAGTAAIKYQGKFTGTPNNGTITKPLDLTGTRYNGLGNPYPSAINIWDFIDGNPGAFETGTLYFWRKKNEGLHSSYCTMTKFAYAPNSAEGGDMSNGAFVAGDESNWIVNPGQGFLIQASAAANTVKFTNGMRRGANNNQFFRNSQPQQDMNISRIWLEMTSATGAFTSAILGYSDVTTDDFDYGWDGVMLNDGPVALYTAAGGQKLSIQAKAGFNADDIVPLSYRANTAGTYTLSITNKDGVFLNGQNVYVLDKTANSLTNLTQQAYFFTTAEGTFENRFEIVYTETALSTNSPVLTENNVIMYKNGSSLHINTGALAMSNVTIYDTRGRLVHGVNDVNASETVIENITAQQQVLLVQIATNGGTVTKKIVF